MYHRSRKSRLLTRHRILPSLKHKPSEVAELNTNLGAQSAQLQKMDAMRFDEQKIFATTKEDLRQVTADVPVVMQRQVPGRQRVQRTVDASTSRVLTLQVGSTSVVLTLTLALVIRISRSGIRVVRLRTSRLGHTRCCKNKNAYFYNGKDMSLDV